MTHHEAVELVFLVIYNEKTTPASPREVRTAANLLHRLTIWRPPQMKSPAAEGRRAGVPTPLHDCMVALVRGLERSWSG